MRLDHLREGVIDAGKQKAARDTQLSANRRHALNAWLSERGLTLAGYALLAPGRKSIVDAEVTALDADVATVQAEADAL